MASSSSTLRPGRTTRAEALSGASGTGPRISNVMRATWASLARLAELHRAPEQRRGRARVLGVGVPWARA